MTSYVELVLSVFLLLVVVALTVRLITQSVPQLWSQQMDVMYYLESAMTLAIGIEFVKMLYTHTPETIIEILLFAISRQMIVENRNNYRCRSDRRTFRSQKISVLRNS